MQGNHQPTSLFDRIIGRPRSPWITLGIAALLFLVPLVAAYLDGRLSEILGESHVRGLLSPAAVITYILLVAPRLTGTEAAVLESLRQIALVDDASFQQLLDDVSAIRPRNELIAFGGGGLLGLAGAVSGLDGNPSWLAAALVLLNVLMFGLLAWAIYSSLKATQLHAALLRLPLRIDPFDITPFQAIGRQSLLLALVFVGGITLSLLFVAFEPQAFLELEFWLMYVPLVLVPFVIFFLNMNPAHRLIAAAKDRELAVVQHHIQQSGRRMLERLELGQSTDNLPAEINALVAYEEQLQRARTWPYNTSMLRTLVVSGFAPAVAVVARVLAGVLFD